MKIFVKLTHFASQLTQIVGATFNYRYLMAINMIQLNC